MNNMLIKINPFWVLLKLAWKLKSLRPLAIVYENIFCYSFFPFHTATYDKETLEQAVLEFKKVILDKFEIVCDKSISFDEYSDIDFLLHVAEKVVESEYCHDSDGLSDIRKSSATLVNYFDYVFNIFFICLTSGYDKEEKIKQVFTLRELANEFTELMTELYISEFQAFFINKL